jgi:hypothetical protein
VEDLRWNNYFLRPKTEIILYFSTHENHFRKQKGTAKGLPVRPTTDMSKALFNVLNNHFSFEGLKILDLLPEQEISVTNLPQEKYANHFC